MFKSDGLAQRPLAATFDALVFRDGFPGEGGVAVDERMAPDDRLKTAGGPAQQRAVAVHKRTV
jgi:hypothetical protein